MKISYIRSAKDKKSFRMMKGLGFDVYEIQDLEKTDETLKELVNQQYDTIFMTNEVASFSEDLVKKYYKSDAIKIFIAPSKRD